MHTPLGWIDQGEDPEDYRGPDRPHQFVSHGVIVETDEFGNEIGIREDLDCEVCGFWEGFVESSTPFEECPGPGVQCPVCKQSYAVSEGECPDAGCVPEEGHSSPMTTTDVVGKEEMSESQTPSAESQQDPVEVLFEETKAMMGERDEFGLRRYSSEQVAARLQSGLEDIEAAEAAREENRS